MLVLPDPIFFTLINVQPTKALEAYRNALKKRYPKAEFPTHNRCCADCSLVYVLWPRIFRHLQTYLATSSLISLPPGNEAICNSCSDYRHKHSEPWAKKVSTQNNYTYIIPRHARNHGPAAYHLRQIEIFQSDIHGWGIRALAYIKKGEAICAYEGVLVRNEEVSYVTVNVLLHLWLQHVAADSSTATAAISTATAAISYTHTHTHTHTMVGSTRTRTHAHTHAHTHTSHAPISVRWLGEDIQNCKNWLVLL